MRVPAWQVAVWKPWFAPISRFERVLPVMRHLGTSVHLPKVDGMIHGQVLWGAELRGERIGIAWDWQQLTNQVCVLADPLTLISNIQLLDRQGCCLTHDERLLHLSAAVNGLDWQQAVLTARSWRPSRPD